MFSQISAKARFSSVPSAGKRVHQVVDVGGVLQQCLTHQHERPPWSDGVSAAHASRRFAAKPAARAPRRSADYVVAIERGLERDSGEEVLVELLAELAQFIERQIAEFDAFFDGKANCIADLLVRGAEGNALVNEIGCRGHRIQIARLSQPRACARD